MNNERRKQIAEAKAIFSVLKSDAESLAGRLVEFADSLEEIKEDEQEAFDNLAESLQGGERGAQMQAAVSALEDVIDAVRELSDSLDSSLADTDDKLDEAAQ